MEGHTENRTGKEHLFIIAHLLPACPLLCEADQSDLLRTLQERNLALHSEGVKMVVDSQEPHFVGVDPDILSTGLVFYYFNVRCRSAISIL